MSVRPRRVVVRAPATSANIGPGFDTLGLALGWHDVVEASAEFAAGDAEVPDELQAEGRPGRPARPVGVPVKVTVQGEGANDVPRDGDHLVARSMLACFADLGMRPKSLELVCRNQLPHGRGLGSSSAAIVAGVLGARALVGANTSDEAMLGLASRLEGHPDNVAPCLLGGFTIAWTGGTGEARAVRLDVHPGITPVVCIPPAPLATETARGLLPASVAHADAAGNVARTALLVEAVTRRPDLLFEATEDYLHQVYRAPAMPETGDLVASLRARGLPAVVSGAGPSVLVLASEGEPERVRELAPGWDVRALTVDPCGATVEIDPGNGHQNG